MSDNISALVGEEELVQQQQIEEVGDGHSPTQLQSPTERTSPGQLQDVTMDNSYGMGYRSPFVSMQPTGNTSPGQGRTVREFEEQMAALRKENFNLKLRLYFTEEKLPGFSQMNTPEGQESLMKQYVDAKVEVEVLQKELKDKQDVLMEAAQALTQMENVQKETEKRGNEIVEELNQKILYLEAECRELEKGNNAPFMDQLMGRSDVTGDISAVQRVRELEGAVKQNDDRIEELASQLEATQTENLLKDNAIKDLETRVKELVFQNAELLEQLESKEMKVASSETSTKRLREELQEYKLKLADNMCALDDAEEKLKEKTEAHMKALTTAHKLLSSVKRLEDETERLKRQNGGSTYVKENSACSESLAPCGSMSESEGFGDYSLQKMKYEQIIENKDKEIAKLSLDVKKKTSNLQNLVNKELWEKNREIERLTKILNKSPSNISQLDSSNQLQKSFTDLEYMEAIERNKSLQKKVDLLIQRLGANNERRGEDTVVEKLQEELKEAQVRAEQAEKWRKECSDLCCLLTSRLEELAGFLDSLLQHKEVLGALGPDRRRAMRKAIDKSFDLSRSLNMSLSGVSMIDSSLAQLSNISGWLDMTVNKDNKTYNSHEDVRHDLKLIEELKAEVSALKSELGKRKSPESNKKDRRSLSMGLAQQSESEDWSEPDRNVSMARMGLEEPLNVRKRHSDSEDSLELGSSKLKIQEKISQLENMISQRDNRILEIQCELVDADNRLKKETLRVIEMTTQLEEYKEHNELFISEIHKLRSNSNMGKQKEDEALIEQLQTDRQRLEIEAHALEMQLDSLQEEIKDLTANHEVALANAEMEAASKTEKLQIEFQEREDNLRRNFIPIEAFELCRAKCEQLESNLSEAKSTIEFLNENEAELKAHLIENEKATRVIKKQLDEFTLQASKTVVERNAALNDKQQLEAKVEELKREIQSLEADREHLNERLNHFILNSKPTNVVSDASGYTSEEAGGRRLQNSSPDLGIESDGRVSSVEMASLHKDMYKILKLSPSKEDCKDHLQRSMKEEDELDTTPTVESQRPIIHDCAKVEQENAELRRKLIRSKRSHEEIINKLRTDNQRKEQLERDIKNQILKTKNVLRNVRNNIENEQHH